MSRCFLQTRANNSAVRHSGARAQRGSPESMNTDLANLARPVFMDSGLAATRRPGMTSFVLFIDRGGARLAHHFVLRAGAAGAADRADELVVFDQRNAAA